MKLIVGLGNPGERYNNTRHNIGFMLLDRLVAKLEISDSSKKFESIVYKKGNLILLKPQTYMNLSGKAVIACSNFFKVPKENLIVVHDDLDLELCKLKVKIGGGSGGNNGIKSIDECIGPDYKRLRIGIGRPQHKTQIVDYVLDLFDKEQEPQVLKTLDLICDNISLLLNGDDAGFLNKIALIKNNGKVKNGTEMRDSGAS